MTQGLQHTPFVLPEFSDSVPAGREAHDFVPNKATKDEPAPEPQAPPPPSFSEEELQAAQREAQEIGRLKGIEEAKNEWNEQAAQREAQLIALLEGLAARMDAEVQANQAQRTNQRSDMANIVLMIAGKLVGSALQTQPLGAIESTINECLSMLAGEARLSIVVSADLEAPLKEHLARQHREQVIEVIADPAMQIGDCRIQWPGGKAERDQEALWQEMERIVTRALAPAPIKNDESPSGENANKPMDQE